MDPIFGQQRCLSWDDPNVDPRVKHYLNNVRNEAISMTIMDMSTTNKRKRQVFTSDLYDDVPLKGNNIYEDVNKLDNKNDDNDITCGTFCLDWLDLVRETLETNVTANTITMAQVKKYCESQDDKEGTVLHLYNVLKDVALVDGITDEQNNVQIVSLFERLKRLRILNAEFLQCVLEEDYSTLEPQGFRKWNQFVRDNDPCIAMFNTMITWQNIWELVRFMTEHWLDELVDTSPMYRRITLWLLYILVHLPRRISASNVSVLRSLAQKCQELQVSLQIPTALELDTIKTPPVTDTNTNLNNCVIQLAVVRYRQRDLLFT